tara:strand:- start:26687 stop:26944 length:258 start_codon:yes stop_codon:yes gene_type:complete
MKIFIGEDSENVIAYETDNINDDKKKLTSNAIIRTVSVLDMVSKALQLANGVYRESLKNTLLECEEAKLETTEDSENGDEELFVG